MYGVPTFELMHTCMHAYMQVCSMYAFAFTLRIRINIVLLITCNV